MKAKTRLKYLVLLLSLCAPFNYLIAQCNPTTDSLALVALYNSTNGPNWNTTWDLTQPMDTWSGVTLNGSGCVQRIWLNYNNLNGPLPNEFGDLTNLREFRASNNNLTGELPMSFYSMSNLQTFWVSSNNLSGTLPSEVGQLTAMRAFNLARNNFSGELPPEIGNLSQISHLYFDSNDFEGTIPLEIANLKQMTFLELYGNQLTGEIPAALANINVLAFIRLSGNQLTGSIPYGFSTMSSLEGLNVSDNQLSGFVPDFSNGNLPLNNLIIHNNHFTFEDLLSSHQFNEDLVTQNNEYSYQEYVFAPQLAVSKDSTLYGEQAATLTIDLGIDENIAENEYNWFKEGIFLTSIVGNNKLTINNLSPADYGIYKCEITNPAIPELALTSGRFTLTEINCRQRDSMALVDLYTATNGANWTNSWNLNSPINTWYGVTLDANGCVQSLDLDGDLSCIECAGIGNNLIGELPATIWQLHNLIHLSLGKNTQLTGILSEAIGHLSQLMTLRLDANLSGLIPNELTTLGNLTHLDLSGNQLSGLVPDFSTNNSVLAFLSVAANEFIFEDITPHIAANESLTSGNFIYAPQAKISDDQSITEDVGYELKLSLPIKDNANHIYKWHKDAVFITNVSELPFLGLAIGDVGNYYCEITNPNAPDLILLSGTYTINVEQPNCHTRDSLALVAFYNATGGANWTNTWDLNQPINTWYGVTLDANGCVASLDLDGYLDVNCPSCGASGNNLVGDLPEAFYELDRLRGIYFSNNQQFGGQLSASINKLNKLETFYSYRSNFSGELPPEIGDLSNLLVLDLNYNHFSGTLPTSLNNLTQLKQLSFWNSNFIGEIPDLSNLTELEGLGLAYNKFTGQIHNSLATLTNLESLVLIGNQLSGEIPSALLNLTNLRFLHLSENQFYGSIPSSLSQLSNLEVIDLSSNNLTGLIPPELSSKNNYDYFDLSGNKLQGTIPESFDTLKTNGLYIQGNQLIGDVSIRLAALSNVNIFRLENNQFSGVIPDLSINNPALSSFIFFENNFTFEHIIPSLTVNTNLMISNGRAADDYRYYPQNKVYKDTSITKNIGDNLTIDLSIDEGLASNVYNWFKNGSYLTTINGDNDFTLSNLQYLDGGTYHCQITNTNAPDLLLESHPIQLIVNNPNCRTQDSLSLVALYSATNGADWTNTWDLNQSMDTWYGVFLDANGCVQTLDLDGFISAFCRGCEGSGNNLVGNLPSQIGDLTALEELSLSGNNLGGTLPDQVGNLLNLKGLHLTNCNLDGALPSTLNNLFNLDFLSLYNNNFSGFIPNLSNLQQLKVILCYGNALEGSIPHWLTSLSNLESIQFFSNELTGSIPNGFENLTNLTNLDFRGNQLTGTLPSNLDQFRKLDFFWFDNNDIEGEIPVGLAKSNLSIGLSGNNLSGVLPAEFVDYQNASLHIDNNELEGDLSAILLGVENMFRLKLEGNNFTGVIPDLSQKNPGLVGFYIQNNQFTFEHILPNHLTNKTFTIANAEYENGYIIAPQQKIFKDTTITRFTTENLSIDLLIDDTVTTNVYKWYKDGQLLTTINGNNELVINNVQMEDAGNYHCEISNPNIPELTLASHDISVTVVDICRQNDSLALIALYNATDGANWTNTWDLNQPMDTWYGVTLNADGCVQNLDLDGYVNSTNCISCTGDGNNLLGSLPNEIWTLKHLKLLSLGGSEFNLTIQIPSLIQNLTNLEVLSFSFTNFSGTIPAEIGSLSNLKILRLDGLGLTGTLPSSVNNLTNLENLIIFNNQLTSLPNLGNLTKLKQLYASYNQLSGTIPSWISNLTNLEFLSFESNQLTGEIPNWISNLSQLKLLSLSRNNLSGLIPSDIGLLSLTDLILSYNQLEGIIPSTIGNMNALWNLRLDNNNLIGAIPTSLANHGHGYLYFENNNLSGIIPNFAINSNNLIDFDITNNEFTFEDITPTINDIIVVMESNSSQVNDKYSYDSQAKIYKDTTILKGIGSSLTIDLLIDDTVTTNVYKWYKDGQLVATINGNNEFTLNDLQESNEGIYHVAITNANAPELTLMSHNITVEVLTDCYFHYEDLYNPIIPHAYNVQTTVESSGTVSSNTSVTFLAGSSITLKEGFHAEAGSNFLAEISDGSACNGLVAPQSPAVARQSTINLPQAIEVTVFPNPSQGQTTITYTLPEKQQVQLALYNLSGQQIKEISPLRTLDTGIYQHELFTHDLKAGFYIVLLKTATGIFSKKIVVTK